MTFNLAQLQTEQAVWATHNFGPDRNPSHTLLGVVEELGELIEPLSAYMNIQNSWDTVVGDIKDSLADMIVFAADYCTGRDWDMSRLDKAASLLAKGQSMTKTGNERQSFGEIDVRLRQMTVACSKLCHHQLKSNQGIRGSLEEHSQGGQLAMTEVIAGVRSLCLILDFDFTETVEAVWVEVRKRDWKKDKATAGGHA